MWFLWTAYLGSDRRNSHTSYSPTSAPRPPVGVVTHVTNAVDQGEDPFNRAANTYLHRMMGTTQAANFCERTNLEAGLRVSCYDDADTAAESSDNVDSISSRVVVRPRLKRIAPMLISGGMFIAFKTGDNSTDPEWQAEPVEAATASI